jgi:predicted amidohydrolase YtcJ
MSDLIVINAKITTLDRENPQAEAVAIRDGKILAVGSEQEARAAAPQARRIDAGGRRFIPGLIDSHIHLIRGGLNYNMELRWDGVPTLADAMAMLKRQAANTPPPQWVRVVGGFLHDRSVLLHVFEAEIGQDGRETNCSFESARSVRRRPNGGGDHQRSARKGVPRQY